MGTKTAPLVDTPKCTTTLDKAADIGPSTARICQDLFEHECRPGHRRLWGIVGLARKYPRTFVEQACTQALHDGVSSYQAIQDNCDILPPPERHSPLG